MGRVGTRGATARGHGLGYYTWGVGIDWGYGGLKVGAKKPGPLG